MDAQLADKRDTTGFGARLKALREERGLSQTSLGALCSPPIKFQQIARIERSQQSPTWPTILRLAVALGVGPDAFLPPGGAEAALNPDDGE